MKLRNTGLLLTLTAVGTLAACSSTPKRVDELEAARAAVQQVESSPDAGKFAADEVTAAHESLRQAETLVAEKKSLKDIQQAAYLAKKHADTAAEQISRGQAEEKTAQAAADRQRVLLQAREQEANVAKEQANAAKQEAQSAQRQAELTAEEARRNQAALEAQLRDLQAKQTDRGMVLTLGDVLFDTGQASLKPGAQNTLGRLGEFLKKSPDSSVIIEGHTDSMGSDSYNMSLSENRANSVKAALVAQGVGAERIVAVGKGEGVPVATNDNAAGRQQNRRVEIVISDQKSASASASN